MDNAKYMCEGNEYLVVTKKYFARHFSSGVSMPTDKIPQSLLNDTTLLLRFLYLCTFAEDDILRYGMMINGKRKELLTVSKMYNIMGLSMDEINDTVDFLMKLNLLFIGKNGMRIDPITMEFVRPYKEMIQELYCMTPSEYHRKLGKFLLRIGQMRYYTNFKDDTVIISLDY